MSGRLDGTVALVTGASSGIGEATARSLAAEGAAVALVARRRERLEQVAKTITDDDGTALVFEADLTDREQAADAVSRTAEQLGRLDVVVNNAGVLYPGPVAEAPAGEWERMIAINVGGVLNVIRPALPHLVAAAARPPRHVADLVNISSTGGRVARAGTAVYSLTKFGLGAFSESLRQELVPNRVRVSLVEPGTVDTELASHTREELRPGIAQMIEGIELLRPDDIAEAITYIVTRNRRVAVNEILIRNGEQTW
ncbi:MAG: SDR family NAD(P)-dependent oxidoreductase [Solirubrobacterales bacterium]|nr:SDR family NAD(P)-dependent oxidoreductase [Solirubrobacterales bacterium]